MPTGCCPVPSVPIPRTETGKNPAAASPFHLPPCLMASGLGSSYVTNWEPLSHHSSQNLLREHPPSPQTVLLLLSCTMACVTTCHCTMGPAGTPCHPAGSCTPTAPSPWILLPQPLCHGRDPWLRISAGLAPCTLPRIPVPSQGWDLRACERDSEPKGNRERCQQACLLHPCSRAAVPADRHARNLLERAFSVRTLRTGVRWCGAQGPHVTPWRGPSGGGRSPVSSWVFAALRPRFPRRCPRLHGYPRIFLLVNNPHGTSFRPQVLRVATPPGNVARAAPPARAGSAQGAEPLPPAAA